ncbi:hypothetical protein F4677DRAFT_209824 [Hypoxylon crocopeplum]|nr:hypothetical protein F4677DRAFT_209824 [Hypoxylon crocopeplum]
MDSANLAAAWLSFAATAVGLGGLIQQASAINEQLDPFHATRTVEYLGVWFQRQAAFPWWKMAKPPPQGPVIVARMSDGFGGVNVLHVTRIPLTPPGRAGWSTILAMFNHEKPVLHYGGGVVRDDADVDIAEKGGRVSVSSTTSADSRAFASSASWIHLDRKALKRYQSHACVTISRTTLITMLVVTNGRPVFQYSDATGFRAGYASYCGQWYITWPIGQEAIVKFAAHDSIGQTEVLPRSFAQRVDRCGQMVSGVVSSPSSSNFAVGFGGRKAAGSYRLEHAAKGFQGAHSGRHLYNMLGGKAFQVDFMSARPISEDEMAAAVGASNSSEIEIESGSESGIVLNLPSKDNKFDISVRMLVPPHEESVIKQALDCLPWTNLSWSMHRGLRDILLAYAKPVMDAHRAQLASLLLRTVAKHPEVLRSRGWDPEFVRDNMGPMASSAVLAGSGNSGDSVRVVTDIVAVYVGDWDIARLDEVSFWRTLEGARRNSSSPSSSSSREREVELELDAQGVVALTKVFVLEWSQEFDYQLYHHLPISMYFA